MNHLPFLFCKVLNSKLSNKLALNDDDDDDDDDDE